MNGRGHLQGAWALHLWMPRAMRGVPWRWLALLALALAALCLSEAFARPRAARIPPEADDSLAWHPLMRKGRPPSPLKLPCSFEAGKERRFAGALRKALAPLAIYTAPRRGRA